MIESVYTRKWCGLHLLLEMRFHRLEVMLDPAGFVVRTVAR
jgi:hypothetical protein